MVAKPRLDVHLYVTPRCNLSCPHCYYDAFTRSRHPENMLSLDEIAAILTGLCERFEADISLEGGEPFLRAGLPAMLAGLSAEVLKAITITTNGTVKAPVDPTVLRGLGMLRFSIDGHLDELQQAMRGVDIAPVLDSCADLAQARVPFWIRMTLWKRNIRELPSLYAWMERHGIERLSLFEYQSSGRGIGQEPTFAPSGDDVEFFLDELATQPRPAGLRQLTVNLAERRVSTVLDRSAAFEAHGWSVVSLPASPNCTINYDGTVGVSPWRVTAEGAPDVFTNTHTGGFLDTIEEAARAGDLVDDSGCISRVQLRVGS